MGFRREITQQHRGFSEPKEVVRRTRYGWNKRGLATMAIVGAFLIVMGLSLFRIGLSILNDLSLTIIAFGSGVFFPAAGTYYSRIRKEKKIQKMIANDTVVSSPEVEIKNTQSLLQTSTKIKKNNLSIFAKIKRGYEKRQKEKNVNSFSKFKNYFSFNIINKFTHYFRRDLKQSVNPILSNSGYINENKTADEIHSSSLTNHSMKNDGNDNEDLVDQNEKKQVNVYNDSAGSTNVMIASFSPKVQPQKPKHPRYGRVKTQMKKFENTENEIITQNNPSLNEIELEFMSLDHLQQANQENRPLKEGTQIESKEIDEEKTGFESSSPLLFVSQHDNLFKSVAANQNMFVNVNRLPSAFRRFSDHIHQLTMQHLVLTGGAVTALLVGTDQFNDFDAIIFEEKENLLTLLVESKPESLHYSCKVVSKKYPIIKVILAEEEVPPCDFIYLPSSTERDFLNFAIPSTAAYIRTKNSLFYVNKITHTCIEIKSHENVAIDSLANVGMLKLLDKTIAPFVNGKTLSLEALHEITTVTGHAHANLFEVDLTCCKKQDEILENAIKKNLAKRDFKLSALYLNMLPNRDTWLVKGFNGAISSVNRELISAVDPQALFKNPEDLLRIFRLGNIMLKLPKFKPDDELKGILNETPFDRLFNDFIFKPNCVDSKTENPENITHLRQINTKLNKLFSKSDGVSVIQMLCDLNIISAMTGIKNNAFLLETAADFSEYLNTVPNHYKKTAFYYFIQIHFCLSPEREHKKSLMEKMKPTLEPYVEAPEFDKYIDYIERNVSNRMMPRNPVPFNPDPAFTKMMISIKKKYREKMNPVQKIPENEASQPHLQLACQ